MYLPLLLLLEQAFFNFRSWVYNSWKTIYIVTLGSFRSSSQCYTDHSLTFIISAWTQNYSDCESIKLGKVNIINWKDDKNVLFLQKCNKKWNVNRKWKYLHKCFQCIYSSSLSRWQMKKSHLNKLVLNKRALTSLESYNSKPIRLQRRCFKTP